MFERQSILLALGAALVLVLLWHARAFYHDDAYVTLRYVDRLLGGDGLTWTDGERVEGFTHPFWLAQIAVLGSLGLGLQTASRLLGILYLGALFYLWYRTRAAPFMLLVLVSQPGVILWTLGGLETISFAFWLVLGCWMTWRATTAESSRTDSLADGLGIGLAFAAAALTRPEGIAAGALMIGSLAWRRRWHTALAAAAAFGVLVGAYEIARFVYYGDLLPNTAYAKAGGISVPTRVEQGLWYLAKTSIDWTATVVACSFALIMALGPRPLVMLWATVPVLLSMLAAGGDHMQGARLLVPVNAVLAFTAAVAGRSVGYRRGDKVLALSAIAVVFQSVLQLSLPVATDMAALVGEMTGRFLEKHVSPGALVSTATAGSTPYYAPSLRFVDSLGLNDAWIARRKIDRLETQWQSIPGHLKGDGAYVLRRQPDVIVLGPAAGYLGGDPRFWFLTDFELLHSPRFRSSYRPYRFDLPPLPHGLTLYLREGSPAVQRLMSIGTELEIPRSRVFAPMAQGSGQGQ